MAHILPESPYRRSLFPAGDATPPSGLAAVCLTGLQRSFPEIGNNIAEAVRDLLAPRHIHYFGIKPVNDSWAAIEYVLPMTAVAPQQVCRRPLSPSLTSFYSCHSHGRGGNLGGCANSMVQELCDLQHCDSLLRGWESARHVSFDVVLRLRADMFWEHKLQLPERMPRATLIVPWQEQNGGWNDHVAVGDRSAMSAYLNRARYLASETILSALFPAASANKTSSRCVFYTPSRHSHAGRLTRPRVTSEHFLAAVMHHERIKVVQWAHWAYCIFTKRALLDQRGLYGCIARMRARTPCTALVCGQDMKYWCNCWNVTCDAVYKTRPSAPQRLRAFKQGPFETMPVANLAIRLLLRGRDKTTVCVDVGSSQQRLLSSGGLVRRDGAPGDPRLGTPAACPWRKAEFTAYRYRMVRRAPNCSVINVTRGF